MVLSHIELNSVFSFFFFFFFFFGNYLVGGEGELSIDPRENKNDLIEYAKWHLVHFRSKICNNDVFLVLRENFFIG